MTTQLLAFAGIALLLEATPGPDFAVVVPNAITSRRAGLATALGVAAGLATHAGIAAAGLFALLIASETAFTIVKVIGVGFLVWLGIRSIWAARHGRHNHNDEPAKPVVPVRPSTAFRKGLLVNVLIPKRRSST